MANATIPEATKAKWDEIISGEDSITRSRSIELDDGSLHVSLGVKESGRVDARVVAYPRSNKVKDLAHGELGDIHICCRHGISLGGRNVKISTWDSLLTISVYRSRWPFWPVAKLSIRKVTPTGTSEESISVISSGKWRMPITGR